MLTPTLKLPLSQRDSLLELIEKSGYQANLYGSVKQDKDGEFQLFVCKKGSTDILGCIIESRKKPDSFHATFSPDLRKIWKFWKLPKQRRLISDICDILINHGANVIEGD